ncbi:hypothetical protein DFH11DRAFT_1688504 [Phellopilus nigrolimitatus]|nr:hypothetical protein DFH11DRAFT_1688504 [Phellopilus nigrolimitatus]
MEISSSTPLSSSWSPPPSSLVPAAAIRFLAFWNGSPDVFSTFSTMLIGAVALVVGELLSTASFIVSILSPTHPVRTRARSVGFFTVAVTLLLVIFWDVHIHAWEVANIWLERHQLRWKQLEDIVRGEYAEELPAPYRDDPSFEHLAVPLSSLRMRMYSSPATPPLLGIDTTQFQPCSPSPTHTPRLSQMPSFSLVGALEFRQVVASLQHQSAGATVSAFESPVTPYVGGHYHSHHGFLSRPISCCPSSAYSQHSAVSQDACDDALPLHVRSPCSQVLALPEDGASAFSSLSPPLCIPRIETTPASPSSETSTRPHGVQHTLHVLFPILHGFREKSVADKLASALAAPVVLALTIMLPVHMTPLGSMGAGDKEATQVGSTVLEVRLVNFEEEGVERVLAVEEDVQEEMHELKFNKWLMAVQMVFGPLFCVAVLFRRAWLLAATEIAGSTTAAFVLVFAGRGTKSVAQMAHCSMGFFVAVVWIMAVADEAVNVLKTFGFIFGLSDMIIGLTVFALGNLLADFVVNVSVTVFASIMSFSICFGGPMLNILLGVGVSGTAVIRSAGGVPFEVDFSATLLVSTVCLLALLLATLVCVPLNDYHLTCCWGVFLVVSYTIIMVINIAVEVKR